MHTKDARAHGESEQRLYALAAWREAPFYSDRERAALDWTEALGECKSIAALPVNARRYVQAVEQLAGCKLTLVSVGADRAQTIQLQNPFRI